MLLDSGGGQPTLEISKAQNSHKKNKNNKNPQKSRAFEKQS